MKVKSIIAPFDTWLSVTISGIKYEHKAMIPEAITEKIVKSYHATKTDLIIEV